MIELGKVCQILFFQVSGTRIVLFLLLSLVLEDRQDRFELIGCRQLLLGYNVRCGVWCLLVLVCLEGGVDVISLTFLLVT